jgi:probable rRNA maturation factor
MILNRQRDVRVMRPALESFLRRVRRQLNLGGTEVTVCLVSDAEIARMNESFRKKKGPTDVLSFPAIRRRKPVPLATGPTAVAAASHGGRRSTPPLPNRPGGQGTTRAVPKPANKRPSAREGQFLGDIAISPSTARRNAKKFRRTLSVELQILILHGMLHLLGYDHETDHGHMDRVEQRLRRRLGLA